MPKIRNLIIHLILIRKRILIKMEDQIPLVKTEMIIIMLFQMVKKIRALPKIMIQKKEKHPPLHYMLL